MWLKRYEVYPLMQGGWNSTSYETVKKLYEPPHDKANKMTVCPAKAQISQGISPVWSESLLCAQWVAKDPSFLHADSEDWSVWVDAQADLSLCWAQMPFCWFCDEAAHMTQGLDIPAVRLVVDPTNSSKSTDVYSFQSRNKMYLKQIPKYVSINAIIFNFKSYEICNRHFIILNTCHLIRHMVTLFIIFPGKRSCDKECLG